MQEMFDYYNGYVNGTCGKIAYEKWLFSGVAEFNLLFVTGRSECTDKYHHLIDMLSVKCNVAVFDHYGQGRSDGVRAHVDSIDDVYVKDMDIVLEKLFSNGLPTAVVAFSLGGLVAARYAQIYPSKVFCQVLVAPMLGVPLIGGYAAAKTAARDQVNAGNNYELAQKDRVRPGFEDNWYTSDRSHMKSF